MNAFKAIIQIMPRQEILDPQGKATLLGLQSLGISELSEVRVGKRIELTLSATDQLNAKEKVEEACQKLLVNPIIEQYAVELEEL